MMPDEIMMDFIVYLYIEFDDGEAIVLSTGYTFAKYVSQYNMKRHISQSVEIAAKFCGKNISRTLCINKETYEMANERMTIGNSKYSNIIVRDGKLKYTEIAVEQ